MVGNAKNADFIGEIGVVATDALFASALRKVQMNLTFRSLIRTFNLLRSLKVAAPRKIAIWLAFSLGLLYL